MPELFVCGSGRAYKFALNEFHLPCQNFGFYDGYGRQIGARQAGVRYKPLDQVRPCKTCLDFRRTNADCRPPPTLQYGHALGKLAELHDGHVDFFFEGMNRCRHSHADWLQRLRAAPPAIVRPSVAFARTLSNRRRSAGRGVQAACYAV